MRIANSRHQRFLVLAVIACCALLLLLLIPVDVFGRAGGGGGYTGGNFSSGRSGGGSGGDDGGLIMLLIWLCFEHPIVGIPLLIIVVAFLIYSGKKGNQGRRGHMIRRGNMAMNEMSRKSASEKLQAEDPAFNEQRFYDRIAVAFVKIQEAWSRQDLFNVRAFISDGIYERFSLQGKEQQDFGYRPEVRDVVVRRMVLAQVNQDAHFQLVTVRIDASCVAYRVSLQDGKYVSGSRHAEPFAEYWSFLRRRGVKTTDQPGLIEGNCPNCGAEIELNQHARCTACDSVLRSGQFDWVLSEITQECEWVDAVPEEIVGVAQYRATHDPGFNVQHMEDRVSVVFWRKVMADRLGDISPLAKVALPEFAEAYQQRLQPNQDKRHYFGDCAVGSVETRGVIQGTDRDRVLVEVRWSGTRFISDHGGPPQRTDYASAFRHLAVLARNKSVKTEVSASVSSAHCPNCGAPESDITSNACEFCGEVLNDGSYDWVLSEFVTSAGDRARQLLNDAQNVESNLSGGMSRGAYAAMGQSAGAPQGMDLLIWSIKMALADNQLDARERALIERVARNRHIPPAQVETLIAAAQQGQLEAPQPVNADQAKVWLTTIADMCLSDGHVDRSEFELLCQAATYLKMSRYDVQRLLKQRQAVMYRAARARLAEARQPGQN